MVLKKLEPDLVARYRAERLPKLAAMVINAGRVLNRVGMHLHLSTDEVYQMWQDGRVTLWYDTEPWNIKHVAVNGDTIREHVRKEGT